MSQNLKFGTAEDLAEILAAQGECSPDFRKQNADVYAGMDCLEQGKLVTGKISQVNDQEVLIDVNYKSEGVIDRGEFKDTDSLEIGSEIEVFVEKLEDEDGRLILSKQKADFVRVWDRIHAAFENNEVVRGTLTKRIKGGVVVDLFGIDAFLPGSQIDLRQIPDINALIGQEFDFKVIKVNKARRNIVVSRRVILEEEHNKQHGDVLKTFAPLQSTLQLSRNIHLHNQIKPIDWAVANGVKVDLVMKLLRDAGVSVRTHMSKVDAQDYAKIKEAVVLEKEKHVIQNANLEKKQGLFSGIFQSLQKITSQKCSVVWLDETSDECVSCGACEAICDAVFSVPEKMHVNKDVNYFTYKAEIMDAAAACPAGVIKYNFS